jgi:hypothetical protein
VIDCRRFFNICTCSFFIEDLLYLFCSKQCDILLKNGFSISWIKLYICNCKICLLYQTICYSYEKITVIWPGSVEVLHLKIQSLILINLINTLKLSGDDKLSNRIDPLHVPCLRKYKMTPIHSVQFSGKNIYGNI